MEVTKFNFKDGEHSVAFPFQAIVDLMGDDSLNEYLSKFQSIKHQIEVLGVGLKYGALSSGTQLVRTDKEIQAMVADNLPVLKNVFAVYDKELATFLRVYFSDEVAANNTKAEPGKSLVSSQ